MLAEATDADEAFQVMLQRVAGYALTGDASEEVFFIFHGPEATMKSTFLAAIAATLGDYATAADPETFLSRSHVGGPRDDIAGMEAARLVVCAEFDRGRKMAEALLKQLTGGDRIRARHLYKTAREFTFTAKIAFHTNHVPAMSDDDGAVWRRAWVVPFTHSVPEEKRDTTVKARLTDPAESGAAILAWAMRGCLAWQNEGLGKPPAVAAATQAVRLSMDPLAGFIADCCIMEPGVWTPSGDLRSAYEQWAKDNRRPAIGLREWGSYLGSRGAEARKRSGVRGWLGVRLVDAETVEATLDMEVSTATAPTGSLSGSASRLVDEQVHNSPEMESSRKGLSANHRPADPPPTLRNERPAIVRPDDGDAHCRRPGYAGVGDSCRWRGAVVSDALELIARAAAFGMVLSSAGLHLRVESVTGVTVPAAFRAELVAAKPELLAYLSWQEAADRPAAGVDPHAGQRIPLGLPARFA